MTTSLLYTSNSFLLREPQCPPPDDEWDQTAPREYRTTNLKAAAKWRRFASENAERIFERAFNKLLDMPELPPFPFLDKHQIEGIKFILSRKRSYLAHAPGAGKTAQAVIASCLVGGQTLFIVPPSLSENWVREIDKFTRWGEMWASTAVVPVSAKQQEMRWNADYIIVPDSMLTRAWVYKKLSTMKFGLVAVDEASRLKEVSAQRSIAFYGGRSKNYSYRGLFQQAERVCFLDGSPLLNRPMELWGPVTALDPEAIDCASQHEFGIKYCGAKINERGQWEYRFSTNEAELKERLQKRLMHVVTEEQLEHPERRRSILYMNEDRCKFLSWTPGLLNKIERGEITEADSRGELASLRKEVGLSKIPFIARYVNERLRATREQILLFVWHREVANKLAELLQSWEPGIVMGGVPNAYRETVFREFQDGRRRIIIGNIQAMGRGHNLQKADRVVFGEFSWTDELNKQCEKRASRRGRDKDSLVRCEYVVLPSSLDEVLLKAVMTKAERVKKVIG